MFTADCFGLSSGQSRRRVAHAGWRGASAGVVVALREEMTRQGHEPIAAAIGPGIGPCCFEVGPDVAERFPQDLTETRWGATSVDLAGSLRRQLEGLEVWLSGACTMHETGFYSHRRSRTAPPQRHHHLGGMSYEDVVMRMAAAAGASVGSHLRSHWWQCPRRSRSPRSRPSTSWAIAISARTELRRWPRRRRGCPKTFGGISSGACRPTRPAWYDPSPISSIRWTGRPWPGHGPRGVACLHRFSCRSTRATSVRSPEWSPKARSTLAEVLSVGLEVRGLMAIPPFTEDAAAQRPHFAMLREIQSELAGEHPEITELSMGMTDDFEVAIEEGSSIIRVGRAIFGERT